MNFLGASVVRPSLTSMECAGGFQFDEIKFCELISHRREKDSPNTLKHE